MTPAYAGEDCFQRRRRRRGPFFLFHFLSGICAWGKALRAHGDSGPRWWLPPAQEVTSAGFQRPGSWSAALLSWVDLGQVSTSQGLSFLICKMGVEERETIPAQAFPSPDP